MFAPGSPLRLATRLKTGRRVKQSILFARSDNEAGLAAAPELPPDGDSSKKLLFKVTHGTYYAVRIPLLRSGFHRVSRDSVLPCNVVWRRPFAISKKEANSTPEAADDVPTGDASADLLKSASPDTAALLTEGSSLVPVSKRQWTNHFPGSYAHLGSKDGMFLAINAMKRSFGAAFDIVPETWVLPAEYEELSRHVQANPTVKLISKPARGSCGREITVVEGDSLALQRMLTFATAPEPPSGGIRPIRSKRWVVQRYVTPPMLVHGRKFDLRVYVAVTSMSPLVAYVYQEGLVRFASEDYNPQNRLAQLTNSSLARKRDASLRHPAADPHHTQATPLGDTPPASIHTPPESHEGSLSPAADPPTFVGPLQRWETRSRDPNASKDLNDDASWPRFKWSITDLKHYVQQHRGDEAWETMWAGIVDVILKALIAGERPISKHLQDYDKGNVYTNQSFELFGFDVMLDAELKPWLIEVNCIPSLESSSAMDWMVKCGCVTDLFNMLMIQPFDRETSDLRLRCEVDAAREELREELQALAKKAQAAAKEGEVNSDEEPPKLTSDKSDELSRKLRLLLDELKQRVAAAGGPPAIEHSWDAADFAMRLADEESYKGGYTRIFPTPSTVQEHSPYFSGSASETRNRDLWGALQLI
ncbi:putative beta-tubulin polyglutamylase [Diplonema papillatum]|nr:putative beta-tubulin polyglutamylase [Diplonema papillatum]